MNNDINFRDNAMYYLSIHSLNFNYKIDFS